MVQSITLQNVADTAIVNNDILGQICFAAPNEAGGTDSILISASMFARSEGTFAADNNATELVFTTGASESAAPGATNYDMTLSSAGNLTVAGTIECATSLTIGSAAMVEADLEFLDGITAGTAAASKTVVLDGSKNIATIGTIGCGAITSTGTSSFATSVKTPLIEYTDGDDSMTINDGGKVTFAAGFDVGSDASGDILYHNGTSYVRLARGSDDEVLTLASGVPSWAAAGGGSGDITGVTLAGDSGSAADTSANVDLTIAGGNGITTSGSSTTLTVALDAALTTVTSAYNASLKLGRDSQNLIDFATTDNKIILRVNNVDEVELVENALSPVTTDGVSLGTSSLNWSDLFLDSGAVINFDSGDVTLTHSSNTLTVAGGTLATAALTASTGTFSGVLKTDDTTDATSTTDGSLQTDGGLSIALDAVVGNDFILLSDASVVHFGASKEITLTHVADSGLTLKHTAGGDNKPLLLTLATGETTLIADEVLSKIAFQAPSEASGGDSVEVAAAIQAVAEGAFNTTSNATRLEFMTGASEAATVKMTLSSAGVLNVSGAITQGIATSAEDPEDDATLDVDLSDGNYFEVDLGANITDIDFTNGAVGQRFIIRFQQHASSGPYTLAWDAVTHDLDGGGSPASVTVSWPGGTAPTMTATDDKADTYGFIVRAEAHFDGYVIGQNITETTN